MNRRVVLQWRLSPYSGKAGVTCFLLLLALASLTRAADMKAKVASELKQAEFIPLPYPQAGMGVGALRWGEDPRKAALSFKLAPQAFSQAFLETVPRMPVAWENQEKVRQFAFSVAGQPGPQLLSAVKAASATVGAGFSRTNIQFVKWGNLLEESVDLQTLSEALVRGWYNMPGRALHAETFSSMRLDLEAYKQRPAIVVRSLVADGMEYAMDKQLAFALSGGAAAGPYGSGSAGLSYSVTNGTTLVLHQPMAIGFNVAYLRAIKPPLPFLAGDQPPAALSPVRFIYTLGRSSEKITVVVDPLLLRHQDKLMAAEESLPKAVVTGFNQIIKQGEPARMALSGEAKNPAAKQWRRLDEGAQFRADELVRLRVVLDEPAYIYLLAKDSQGQAAVLYPKTAGEDLSRGEEKLLPKGEWIFPQDVLKEEGMTFGNDPAGMESFVVVAARNKPAGLPESMAAVAQAARAQPPKPAAATRSANLAFLDIMRLPTGYSTIPASTNPPPATAAAAPSTNRPTVASATPPAAAPVMAMQPLFSGLNSATVLTLNLNRIPVK